MEKQKAKYTYGILEKQFRNLFEKASASKGVTGEVLLQLCEARLIMLFTEWVLLLLEELQVKSFLTDTLL
jgi:hypothetical protein